MYLETLMAVIAAKSSHFRKPAQPHPQSFIPFQVPVPKFLKLKPPAPGHIAF